ncbi:WAT1-related protein At1g25270-like [Cynara cardunculus var. scolymus]|uniref:WAT1-related protein At1g25270-like n=1 Tax=Cynara cardunculus var. scolymus TaxID=59895 RepID=UPI000D62563D|nr:WAT1-related protein At1g25270-like [Cynara cardunculus var. scolymus]
MVGKICNVVYGLKPVLLMVAVQTTFAGVNVFYKLAANDGMNLPVLVAYRFLFSTAFIVPLAFFVERKKRPKMTWMVLLQGFCCGLFGGSLAQNFYIKALSLTSATFAASTTNLMPVITFVLAVCFRMERLGWKTTPGAAKIMGTVIGVGGAMLLTLYKGADLHLWETNVDLLHGQHHETGGQNSSNNMVLGSLLAIGSCISYSIWLIIQTNMVEKYPCPYSVTALTSTMGAVQAVVFVLCTERHWSEWKLGWNVRLLTVAYSGMLASGLMFTFIAWCVQMRGPLFVSAFNPLMLVLVAIAGSLVLNETLHLGSVLGAILIILGLYLVLWGKGKEVKKVAQLCPVRESSIGTDNGAIAGDSERSSIFGVTGDSESKHSSVQSGNGESRRVEVVVTSPER